MFDSGVCTRVVLNCTAAVAAAAAAAASSARARAAVASPPVAFLDPADLMNSPVVTCLAAGDVAAGASGESQLLVAFVGAQCPLWRDEGCRWNATLQLFHGPLCVYADSLTCGCSHLTDFTGSAAIRIPVASTARLAAVTPLAIASKLKVLATLLACMFGGMLLCGGLAWHMDKADRAAVLRRLRSNDRRGSKATHGHVRSDNGVWCGRSPSRDPPVKHSPPARGAACRRQAAQSAEGKPCLVRTAASASVRASLRRRLFAPTPLRSASPHLSTSPIAAGFGRCPP